MLIPCPSLPSPEEPHQAHQGPPSTRRSTGTPPRLNANPDSHIATWRGGTPGGTLRASAQRPSGPLRLAFPCSCPCLATGENGSLSGSWGEVGRAGQETQMGALQASAGTAPLPVLGWGAFKGPRKLFTNLMNGTNLLE